MKDLSGTVLAVAVGCALGLALALLGGATNKGGTNLGVSAGPESFDVAQFRSGVVVGGTVVATNTDNGTATLLNSDLITRSGYTSILRVKPNYGALTLTLPASSTLTNFAPKPGDRVTVMVENQATAATTTTIAAGAGMDLQEPDGQNVVIGQDNYAILTFIRESSGDFVVVVDETIPAD